MWWFIKHWGKSECDLQQLLYIFEHLDIGGGVLTAEEIPYFGSVLSGLQDQVATIKKKTFKLSILFQKKKRRKKKKPSSDDVHALYCCANFLYILTCQNIYYEHIWKFQF